MRTLLDLLTVAMLALAIGAGLRAGADYPLAGLLLGGLGAALALLLGGMLQVLFVIPGPAPRFGEFDADEDGTGAAPEARGLTARRAP